MSIVIKIVPKKLKFQVIAPNYTCAVLHMRGAMNTM